MPVERRKASGGNSGDLFEEHGRKGSKDLLKRYAADYEDKHHSKDLDDRRQKNSEDLPKKHVVEYEDHRPEDLKHVHTENRHRRDSIEVLPNSHVDVDDRRPRKGSSFYFNNYPLPYEDSRSKKPLEEHRGPEEPPPLSADLIFRFQQIEEPELQNTFDSVFSSAELISALPTKPFEERPDIKSIACNPNASYAYGFPRRISDSCIPELFKRRPLRPNVIIFDGVKHSLYLERNCRILT